MLYRQYGWFCAWLLCRLHCSNAIGRRNAEVKVVTSMGLVSGLAMDEKPPFHNVFRRLTVNRSVTKIRSHFINKQTSSLLALFISNLVLCIVAV